MKKQNLKTLLIFILLIACKSHAQEFSCINFKTGRFETYVNDKFSSKVVRSKKFQKEYTPKTGVKVKLKVEWIDDCTYKLTFVKANKKFYKNRNGKKVFPELIVRIIDGNETEYIFVSSFIGVKDFIHKAKAIKIK